MPSVHTIDLQYLGIPQAIAAYVVVGDAGPVLIETGPASTLVQLVDGLAPIGLKPGDVRHALVTHIHLDHAGAAGHLARHGTMIHVHEFGAKHLIDPSRLIDSATRIYGDQMDRLWGRIIPVPENQIVPVHDGDVIDVGDLRFTAIETPGHARHHHAFAIELDGQRVCFVGDIAGITVPGIPEPPIGRFIAVPTPPPEFDPQVWKLSIDRLQQMKFDLIYLTHFAARYNVSAHFERLKQLVDEHADFVRQAMEAGQPRAELLGRYIEWSRRGAMAEGVSEEDVSRYVSTNLLTMNVDGMIRHWMKTRELETSKRQSR